MRLGELQPRAPRPRGWWLLFGLLLCGCGTRAEARDGMCASEKPHAYEKKPLFANCHRIRTNESAKDPATGVTRHNIHHEYFCCD